MSFIADRMNHIDASGIRKAFALTPRSNSRAIASMGEGDPAKTGPAIHKLCITVYPSEKARFLIHGKRGFTVFAFGRRTLKT